jgi:hypothetical protein
MNASVKGKALEEAVDVWGSDPGRWPEGAPVSEARAALLADRSFRAYRDGAASLERTLRVIRDSVDRDVRASGAPERLLRALVAVPARASRWSPRSWAAVAAALVLAAGLGSYIDFAVVGTDNGSYEAVVVDPFVFGTAAVEAE